MQHRKNMILSRIWGCVPPEEKLFASPHMRPGTTFIYKPTGELLVCKLYFKGTGMLRAWGLPDEPIALSDTWKCRVLPMRDKARIQAALAEGLHFNEPRGKVVELLDLYYQGKLFDARAETLKHATVPEIVEALRRRKCEVISPRQALEWAELKRRADGRQQ